MTSLNKRNNRTDHDNAPFMQRECKNADSLYI